MSKHCLANTDKDMSLPIPIDILSDSDSDNNHRRKSPPNDAIDLVTPPQFLISKKKQKTGGVSNPSDCSVFVIDEDEVAPRQDDKWIESSPVIVCETPFSVTPGCSGRNISSFSDLDERVVADTPMSELLKFEATIVKCNKGVASCEPACSLMSNRNSAEITGTICVDSDDSEDVNGFGAWKHNKSVFASKLADNQELGSSAPSVFHGSSFEVHPLRDCSHERYMEDDISMADAGVSESVGHISKKSDDATKFKKLTKEDKLRLIEEKKQQKEREKLLKAESKAEAAKMKRLEKEMKKWEKGKYALKCIVAEIDKKVVELGSIGGNLLTGFAEKGLQYRITSNPVERTIMWTMAIPEDISMIPPEGIRISYVLVVYEAEEFCNLVMNDSLMDHVQSIQHSYPNYTVCYLTNRLMAYINKREQAQYKNAANYPYWKRPAIEEVLAKLATNFFKVHSRHCIDEMELAEHVVGLTCSLASCQFRKRLTRLSVNANGCVVPKDCADKNLIKKNVWLKALVAIPKVQPRFAIAIWKKYPTMKSLLSIYMDPTKSVHEKEFVLKDLTTEGLFGDDRRLGEVCSKRIYRILMAQSGSIKTDDVENGADFFSHAST